MRQGSFCAAALVWRELPIERNRVRRQILGVRESFVSLCLFLASGFLDCILPCLPVWKGRPFKHTDMFNHPMVSKQPMIAARSAMRLSRGDRSRFAEDLKRLGSRNEYARSPDANLDS